MGLNTEASAALVYLILYAIIFAVVVWCYLTGRMRLRSRYSIILFHITIRLASQATGLAFGIVGYDNTNLLVAYFILGAEGYFTLVLCAYRFLISWHYHNFESGNSWLERRYPPGTPWHVRLGDSMSIFSNKGSPMGIMHWFLIAANTIIIVGGSQTAGASARLQSGEWTYSQFTDSLNRAKIFRTTGQAIFLLINSLLLFSIVRTIRQWKRENPTKGVHPTLWVLLMAWPLLFVRGIYGVLAGVLPTFNYFAPQNYTATGLSNSFVISEYILGTTMEWASCVLLVLTRYTSRNDPPKQPLKEWVDKGLVEKSNVAAPGVETP